MGQGTECSLKTQRAKKKPERTVELFKKVIEEALKALRWQFYLNAYTMHIVWEIDQKGPDVTALIDVHPDAVVAASIAFDEVYLHFTVTVYKTCLDIWRNSCEEDSLFEILVHEFCHSIIDPIFLIALRDTPKKRQGILQNARERQTQLMSQVLVNQGNLDDIRASLK
jgi:hypothetical protein